MHLRLRFLGTLVFIGAPLFFVHTAAAESSPSLASSPTAKPTLENSVVKIFATKRYAEVYRPWTKQAPVEETGTGIVIEGNRILTNAHVVLYAAQLQVQPNQSGDKLSAKVAFVAPGIDLAVLTLEDGSFFESHPPIPRARILPTITDTVFVYGFPSGGDTLSITKGIVSRVEFVGYNFGVSGLRVQIDAAINPGNSGGPALVNGEMIGLAFQTLNKAQNIGYIIPCEEIELFLKDTADGRYDGKPALYLEDQKLQNAALRPYLGVPAATHGLLVHASSRDRSDSLLRKGDVLTMIGNHAIDDEGMVVIGSNIRVRFEYFVQHLGLDGHVPLTVQRGASTLLLEEPVAPPKPLLVPALQGEYPSFFVYGPLVLTIATRDFVDSLTQESWPILARSGSPLLGRLGDDPAFPGEQLVVVACPFLPHSLAKGYWKPQAWVLAKIDDVPVKNLAHAVELLRDAKNPFVVLDFAGRNVETFVFPRQETVSATEELLSDNGIRAQGSPDVLAIWNAKTGSKASAVALPSSN